MPDTTVMYKTDRKQMVPSGLKHHTNVTHAIGLDTTVNQGVHMQSMQ